MVSPAELEQLRPLIEQIVNKIVEQRLAQGLRVKSPPAPSKRSERGEPLVGADRQYGYKLGCDGFTSPTEARRLLGNISITTLKRRIANGLLRKGKHPGTRRIAICRRSLQQYIERMKV